ENLLSQASRRLSNDEISSEAPASLLDARPPAAAAPKTAPKAERQRLVHLPPFRPRRCLMTGRPDDVTIRQPSLPEESTAAHGSRRNCAARRVRFVSCSSSDWCRDPGAGVSR